MDRVTVVVLKRRGPPKPPAAPAKIEPMLLSDVIARVERLHIMAVTLRGAGRNGPEAFTEDKSELTRALHLLEQDLRRRGVRSEG